MIVKRVMIIEKYIITKIVLNLVKKFMEFLLMILAIHVKIIKIILIIKHTMIIIKGNV